MSSTNRRKFIKNIGIGTISAGLAPSSILSSDERKASNKNERDQFLSAHHYNGPYTGEYLNRIAFPLGGIGAGMFCIEGTGAISHMSIRNKPEIFNEPEMFAAISIKGLKNGAKVIGRSCS